MKSFAPVLIGGIFLTAVSWAADSGNPDPYARVRTLRLHNGMKAVLSPSVDAKTALIKVRIDAGQFSDESGKAGTAHLLEHYLFTDAKLSDDMTLLEAIKEKGGSGNAYTQQKTTIYFATVPADLAPWIVDVFHKILFEKSFDESRIQHAKGPVFLEIGHPNPLDYLMVLINHLWPDFARAPDEWRSEFGIREPELTPADARVDLNGLTGEEVKRFYDRYYYPGNITLFLAGKFDESKILPLVEQKFGSEPDRKGSKWVEPAPVSRTGNYYRSEVTSNIARIEVGTKVSGLSFEDEVAARVYLEYLAHRLMKNLRNVRGETYTVYSDTELRKGSGFLTVRFEAPREHYSENLKLVRDMIDKEARQGQFSPEMFKEAYDLYGKGFERIDHDGATMMRLADRWDHIEREYRIENGHLSDYAVFSKLTHDEMVRRLKLVFAPNMKVERLYEPPLFFRFEIVAIVIAAFGAWMFLGRSLLAKNFRHDRIRWVRKMSYPPAYLLQIFAFSMIGLSALFIYGLMSVFWEHIDVFQRSFLVSDYLFSVLWLGSAILCAQCVLGAFARKVMVVENSIWVKSLGYWAATYDLGSVERIELRSPFGVLFSPKTLLRVKYHCQFYDPRLWRRGLLIHFKDGRSCFLGVRSAENAIDELNAMIEKFDAEGALARSPILYEATAAA
ncbi:MAG: pitrilysin family protein [Oligoflexia bacterium]|nr:pitrilysin family protein [Oligoflexia bacterium]